MFISMCGCKANDSNVEVVTPQEFLTGFSENPDAYLLDVRRPDEYAEGHLEGAHLLDWLNTDAFKTDAVNLDKKKTIYIYCRSGRRSNQAANYLAEEGYRVVDMDGGILAWKKAGLPTVTSDSE